MSSKLKPWLVLGLIFAIGILTGSELTVDLPSYFARPADEQQMKQHWMSHLVRRLKLTADQQAQILPILAAAEVKIQSLHRDEVQRGSEIIKQANDQMTPCLTPVQVVELQRMETEREKLFADHIQPGNTVGHDGSDGGGMQPTADPQTNGASPGPESKSP